MTEEQFSEAEPLVERLKRLYSYAATWEEVLPSTIAYKLGPYSVSEEVALVILDVIKVDLTTKIKDLKYKLSLI